MAVFISLIVGVAGGALGMLFFLKNNPKYINFDKMLAAIGEAKLSELKSKIDKIF